MTDIKKINNRPKRGCFSRFFFLVFLIFSAIYLFNLFIDYRLLQMDLTEVNISSGKYTDRFVPDPMEKSIRVKFMVPRAYTKYFIGSTKLKEELEMYATYPDFKTYRIADNEVGLSEPRKIDNIRIGVQTINSPLCYRKKVSEDKSMQFLGKRDYDLNLYGSKSRDSYKKVNGKLVYGGMNYFLPTAEYDYIKEISCSTNIPNFIHNCVVHTYDVGPFCIVYTFPDKFLKDWKIIDQKVRDFIQQFIVEYKVDGQKLELNITEIRE